MIVAYFMEKDLKMLTQGTKDKMPELCKVQSMQLPESLGEIDQLFCDKTGTLTQNALSFRSISLQGERYEGMTREEILGKFYAKKGDGKAEQEKLMEMLTLCFAMCNDITIVKDEETGKEIYNGES